MRKKYGDFSRFTREVLGDINESATLLHPSWESHFLSKKDETDHFISFVQEIKTQRKILCEKINVFHYHNNIFLDERPFYQLFDYYDLVTTFYLPLIDELKEKPLILEFIQFCEEVSKKIKENFPEFSGFRDCACIRGKLVRGCLDHLSESQR